MGGSVSKSKSSSQSQQQSTAVNYTNPALTAIAPNVASSLKGLITGSGSNSLAGIPDFTGSLTAPISSAETAGLHQLQNLTGAGGPTASLISSLSGPNNPFLNPQAQTLLNDTLSGKYLDPASNPFLSDAITAAQRPTLEGLTQTLTRDLPGRFTQAGQFIQPQGSSAFDYAAGLATRGAANAIGDIATKLSAQNYQNERQGQLGALGLAGNLATSQGQQVAQLTQQQVQDVISNLQQQALPRLIQQQGITQGLDIYKTRLNALLQSLQLASGSQAPVLGNQSSGSSTGKSSAFSASVKL